MKEKPKPEKPEQKPRPDEGTPPTKEEFKRFVGKLLNVPKDSVVNNDCEAKKTK